MSILKTIVLLQMFIVNKMFAANKIDSIEDGDK